MHKVTAILALSVCALVATAPALAADYDDTVAGSWSAGATWGVTEGYFPGSPIGGADVVTIDSVQVTADIAITPTVADVASIEIANNGVLYFNSNITQTATLQLNGGTLRINRDDLVTNSPLTVKSDSTLQIHSVWNYTGCYLDGVIADYDGSNTGVLTKTEAGRVYVRASNPDFSGGWDVQAGTLQFRDNNGMGTGTVTVADGAVLYIDAPHTTANTVNVQSGGWLSIGENDDCPNVVANLADDTDMRVYGPTTYTGSVNVAAGATVRLRASTRQYGDGTWGGEIAAPSDATVHFISEYSTVSITGDNEDLDADVHLDDRHFIVYHPNALGTNTTGATVTIEAGAYLKNLIPGDHVLPRSITLNGGTLETSGGNSIVGVYTGTVTLAADSHAYLTSNGQQQPGITVTGTVTGPGKWTYSGRQGDRHAWLTLTNPANDYAGGTEINYTSADGTADDGVRVQADGALGTGPVDVLSGRLYADPANTGSAALNGPTQVNVAGGTLYLESTETRQFNLMDGGALWIGAGSTLDAPDLYSPGTGVFQVYDGAILDNATVVATGSVPALADIQGAAAQNQIYKGVRGTFSGDETFGPGDGGSPGGEIIYKGLATVDERLTVSGTMTEHTAGGGFSLYAQRGRRLTLASAARLSATGTITLNGDGPFHISGTPIAAQAGVIDKNSAGALRVNDAGGIPTGKTLNLNAGYMEPLHDSSVSAGATVNINDGAGLVLGRYYSGGWKDLGKPDTGTFNVNARGAVRLEATDSINNGAAFNFNEGCLMVLAGNSVTTPTTGTISFILTHRDRDDYSDFLLGDNARITTASDYTWNVTTADIATGEIQAAGTQARLAAPQGYLLTVNSKVNMPGQTLIIGDPNDFQTRNQAGTAASTISQDGRVRINNSSNDIGDIDIQAGELYIYGGGGGSPADDRDLGGPDTVHIASGARLYMDADWPVRWDLATVITGDGEIYPHYNNSGGGNSSVRMQPAYNGGLAPAALSPGNSIGELTVTGNLSFGSVDTGTTQYYGELRAEFNKGAGTPGVDWDHVQVSQSATLTNGQLVLNLPVPSNAFNPATVSGTVLTAASLSGTFTVVSLDPAMDATVASYYDVSEVVAYDATSAAVVGTGTMWTAHKGDATLNDVVDVLDLARLANNFGKDVANGDAVTWETADFNLDGIVDVLDLAAIANNFGYDGTGGGDGGGAPVPEPASLAVLALGGAALLRRRRR